MTDRELLELAAKAAGVTGYRYSESFQAMANWNQSDGGWFDAFCLWNPLEDDGDALRLAVKLGLCIICHATQVEYSTKNGGVGVVVEQKFRDAEATRRAIVRAAAQIGAQM